MRFLVAVFSLLLLTSTLSAQKRYQRNYYKNGVLKSEGWTEDNLKIKYWTFYYSNGNTKKEGHFKNGKPVKYWYFYRENGTKESEGHFIHGKKNNWWLFYDAMEKLNHKCQLKNNLKNGYCLMYQNERLVSARRFKDGKQLKEWTDFRSFKRDNNLNDLK
ncbi:hypothetical protein H7U19_01735 [Hyunsoonleella sp. SJ7]|uniref:MORN repeat variant n=1 Tax=Hyunsoonleella aquatilis TaxID=2762758 RepID=A0A923H8Z6_9FLAO|nr:hypothetical protein [Hyunsoonleella aquatilis]MBC3757107.1 hypothetical protein [Hyunsoonleella aquatilis]